MEPILDEPLPPEVPEGDPPIDDGDIEEDLSRLGSDFQ